MSRLSTRPPRWADRLLGWYCAPELREEIQGDLHELFHKRVRRAGPWKARVHYWIDIVRFFRPYVLRRTHPSYAQARGPIMLKNYVTVALRNLRKHKSYAFINTLGLAIGITCCLLILLYVQDELRYDRHHEQADRIYRVAAQETSRGDGPIMARTPHPLGPTLVEEVPEVAAAVRFRRTNAIVHHEDALFKEERFYFADAAVFDVFSYPFLAGDPAAALAAPATVVLTAETALRYFGPANPIGQTLAVDGLGDLRVTGVLLDPPATSHFAFDFLASYTTLQTTQPEALQAWDTFVTSTYVLLADGPDEGSVEAGLQAVAKAYLDQGGEVYRLSVDPLTDLHLYAHLQGDLGAGSDARYLYIFSSIALFILLIACINFMSLTSARSTDRAREVGMRKVLGAYRRQLIQQFLGESILLSLAAVMVAALLVQVALPGFNTVTGKAITLSYGATGFWWVGLLGLGVLVGLLAGCYPAFALSAFRPLSVLKGQLGAGLSGTRVRKGLVTVQFGMAMLLLTSLLVMSDQLAYMQRKDLGFNKDQVVVLPLQPTMRAPYEAIKSTVLDHPNVLEAAASYHTPGRGLGNYFTQVEGTEEVLTVPTYIVDYDFIEAMEMEVVAGRGFSASFSTDADEAFIVNETAARLFGWDDPLGKHIVWDSAKQGRVVGVVKDFHFASLHTPIAPLVMHIDPSYFRRLSIRIIPENVAETLAFLEATWTQYAPDRPFEFTFLDDDFAHHYLAERKAAQLVGWAAGLGLFVACLGLLGLSAFIATRRTKEIGIRKVLGASVGGIVAMLSKDFVKVIAVGFLIAAPLAFFAMDTWLQGFAYRVEISWRIFLMAGLVVLVVALTTVSYQAIRAALTNPVDCLRHE